MMHCDYQLAYPLLANLPACATVDPDVVMFQFRNTQLFDAMSHRGQASRPSPWQRGPRTNFGDSAALEIHSLERSCMVLVV
jgi:hypothetical protein